MDDIYMPELSIILMEKDIIDAIDELKNESKKINSAINSLITSTDSLKTGWSTEEGITSTDKIKKLTASLEEISKQLITKCSSIPNNIKHEII